MFIKTDQLGLHEIMDGSFVGWAGFYPDVNSFRGMMTPGTHFSSTRDYTRYDPQRHDYPNNPGGRRQNFKLVRRGRRGVPAVNVKLPWNAPLNA